MFGGTFPRFRQEPLLYMSLQKFRGEGGQDALKNYIFNLGGGAMPPPALPVADPMQYHLQVFNMFSMIDKGANDNK